MTKKFNNIKIKIMKPVEEPKITPKKIVEILKILGYCFVFSLLLLTIILAVVNKSINLSQIFNSQESKAFFDDIKVLPFLK